VTKNWTRTVLVISAAIAIIGGVVYTKAVRARLTQLAALQDEKTRLIQRPARDAMVLKNHALQTQIDSHFKPNLADVLQDMNAGLSRLGISDPSITTTEASQNGRVERIPVNLAFTASFASVFDFVQRLNHDKQIVRLRRMQIAREVGTAANALAVTLQLETFVAEDSGGTR